MKASPIDDPLLASLPHPDDDAVLAAARQALLVGMSNVFIVGEEEFHIDACFLALYHQLKLESGLQLHRMMSPKVDEIVAGAQRRQLGLKQVPDEEDDQV